MNRVFKRGHSVPPGRRSKKKKPGLDRVKAWCSVSPQQMLSRSLWVFQSFVKRCLKLFQHNCMTRGCFPAEFTRRKLSKQRTRHKTYRKRNMPTHTDGPVIHITKAQMYWNTGWCASGCSSTLQKHLERDPYWRPAANKLGRTHISECLSGYHCRQLDARG